MNHQQQKSAGITPVIRDVTEEEIAFYHENGWAFFKQLVDPDYCAVLLQSGRDWLARENKTPGFYTFEPDDCPDPFGKIMFSEAMGRNAQRLINRKRLSGVEVGVRYRTHGFVCKAAGDQAVPYHQDSSEHGSDRAGELQFWLALDEATPDMGTMRFLSGVHREGTLGSLAHLEGTDLLDYYPRLTELYQLTDPIDYRTGDATVHHGYMIHGSGPNVTDRMRSSHIFSYTPADTRFWEGRPNRNLGSDRIEPESDRFPVICP